jgi:hypothetical protein
MEPFLTARLKGATLNTYTDIIKAVISNINQFLRVLAQSYGDLDEAKIFELQLIKLKQNASVPEYLTRFTQYSSRIY